MPKRPNMIHEQSTSAASPPGRQCGGGQRPHALAQGTRRARVGTPSSLAGWGGAARPAVMELNGSAIRVAEGDRESRTVVLGAGAPHERRGPLTCASTQVLLPPGEAT